MSSIRGRLSQRPLPAASSICIRPEENRAHTFRLLWGNSQAPRMACVKGSLNSPTPGRMSVPSMRRYEHIQHGLDTFRDTNEIIVGSRCELFVRCILGPSRADDGATTGFGMGCIWLAGMRTYESHPIPMLLINFVVVVLLLLFFFVVDEWYVVDETRQHFGQLTQRPYLLSGSYHIVCNYL